jgi:O-antigen/teichoic acid export membrane protein
MFGKIKGRYVALPRPVKATVWFTISGVLQKAVQFFMLPIYTRLLSPEQYGQYSIFQSWYLILEIIVTLHLFRHIYYNGLSKYDSDRDGFASSMLGLSMLTTVIFFILYISFSQTWNKLTGLSTLLMLFMFLEFFFMPGYEYWQASKRYDYECKNAVIAALIITVVTPFVGVPVIYYFHLNNPELKGNVAIISRVLVSVAVYIIPFVVILAKRKKLFNKEYWKYSLAIGLPVVPHQLSLLVLQQSDRIIIERICGGTQAGIYSIAYSISMVMTIINTAINASFTPWTYQRLKTKQIEEVRTVTNMLLLIIAIINIVLIVIAPELVSFMAPKQYHEAIYVIPPIAISAFFMFLSNRYAIIEYYYEKTKFVMYASSASAILNIVLNLVLIRKFGYFVAGYTTLLCYAFLCIAHCFFLRKVLTTHYESKRVNDNKTIMLMALACIGLAFVFLLLYPYWYLRYIFVLVFIALSFIFGRKHIAQIRMLLKNTNAALTNKDGLS